MVGATSASPPGDGLGQPDGLVSAPPAQGTSSGGRVASHTAVATPRSRCVAEPTPLVRRQNGYASSGRSIADDSDAAAARMLRSVEQFHVLTGFGVYSAQERPTTDRPRTWYRDDGRRPCVWRRVLRSDGTARPLPSRVSRRRCPSGALRRSRTLRLDAAGRSLCSDDGANHADPSKSLLGGVRQNHPPAAEDSGG